MSEPLYSIGTWDTDAQAFTPQEGVPAFNLTRKELVQSMRMLQNHGYSCHRFRGRDENHQPTGDVDSDTFVLIERTDGMPESEILERWKR